MKRVIDLSIVGLLLVGAAAGADGPACGVQKGLYNEWLRVPKTPNRGRALIAPGANAARQAAIVREYENFFRGLSKAAGEDDPEALQSCCVDAAGDPLASLTCRGAAYLKGQRAANNEFLDAFPAGRRGAQMIWDLETIAADQAYKLLDELFLLVLDGRETAASKYFNLLETASGAGERRMEGQIKVLLQESPAVVVKEWEVLRKHQPKLKQIVSEMAAGLPESVLQKIRRDLVAFCPADNLDCPEIRKVFGLAE